MLCFYWFMLAYHDAVALDQIMLNYISLCIFTIQNDQYHVCTTSSPYDL